MLNYIAAELKQTYNILKATDGKEGLKQTETDIPDLIVCDVMMPNMDGFEFCKKIKSNINTSHIPVILLTAKAEKEAKYEGIETGADDYIPKPFEMDYLRIRIKNLLHSRELLRKHFQSSIVIEPSAVTVTSVDNKFLTALIRELEAGIPDSDFSISTLESKIGMSHANFYRKIKSLTGQSGQELLLGMRMKRAHQIISDSAGIRIAEVAYMTGFENPNYFSKCFKKTFGMTPSELIK
jgi:YesN/AraC family two-component response regulator